MGAGEMIVAVADISPRKAPQPVMEVEEIGPASADTQKGSTMGNITHQDRAPSPRKDVGSSPWATASTSSKAVISTTADPGASTQLSTADPKDDGTHVHTSSWASSRRGSAVEDADVLHPGVHIDPPPPSAFDAPVRSVSSDMDDVVAWDDNDIHSTALKIENLDDLTITSHDELLNSSGPPGEPTEPQKVRVETAQVSIKRLAPKTIQVASSPPKHQLPEAETSSVLAEAIKPAGSKINEQLETRAPVKVSSAVKTLNIYPEPDGPYSSAPPRFQSMTNVNDSASSDASSLLGTSFASPSKSRIVVVSRATSLSVSPTSSDNEQNNISGLSELQEDGKNLADGRGAEGSEGSQLRTSIEATINQNLSAPQGIGIGRQYTLQQSSSDGGRPDLPAKVVSRYEAHGRSHNADPEAQQDVSSRVSSRYGSPRGRGDHTALQRASSSPNAAVPRLNMRNASPLRVNTSPRLGRFGLNNEDDVLTLLQSRIQVRARYDRNTKMMLRICCWNHPLFLDVGIGGEST
jgi:hypothetical protein